MMQSNSDVILYQFENHLKNIMKIGFITKKAIVIDHFTVIEILFLFKNN
jgi:hypothetical protein